MTAIVLIDQDSNRANNMARNLSEHGLNIETALGAESVLAQPATALACIVTFHDCLDNQLKKLAQLAPTLVLSSQASISEAVRSMQQGAVDYLSWPLDMLELNAAIERASVQVVSTTSETLSQFPLIGESPAMQMLRESIGKIGPTDCAVLLLGESGTGKELVARAVHASSTRSNAPLISVNCAAVPANLIEVELFGIAQLSTQTLSPSGLVAAANGGTLFLDEVAELPESAQAKLLQVLMGEHRRVGEAASEPVDVRVIATTHRNLIQMVENGSFRQDLYYRLNVVSLDLPPLRTRQDDVIVIAQWLLARTSERLNKANLSFSADATNTMRAYHWPGNVRELENAVERAVILSDPNSAISQNHLAIEPTSDPLVDSASLPTGELTSLEDYFVKFVQQNQDQLTETELAGKLGISRKSLWERRQRLDIPRRKTKKRGPRQDSASQ